MTNRKYNCEKQVNSRKLAVNSIFWKNSFCGNVKTALKKAWVFKT